MCCIKLFSIAHVLKNVQNRIYSSGVEHKANIYIALDVFISSCWHSHPVQSSPTSARTTIQMKVL